MKPLKYVICRSVVWHGEIHPKTIESYFTGFNGESTTWDIWEEGYRAAILLPKGVANTLASKLHNGDPNHNYWISSQAEIEAHLHIRGCTL